MTERYFIGAYWANRKEDVESCTKRMLSCLSQLCEIDEVFGQWYEKSSTLKNALSRKVELTENRIKELLLKGRNRTDIGKNIIEDLGYNLYLWNGLSEGNGRLDINISCGMYPENCSLVNRCIINLPDVKQGPSFDRVIRSEKLSEILKIVARNWQPDWAVVTTYPILKLYKKIDGAPYCGWLLYLDKQRGVVPDIPFPSRKEIVENYGSIVVATGERFDVTIPGHLKILDHLNKLLTKNNLFGPVK